MLGTFGGALEARQIDASGGRLTADVTGEVETEDRVLVIRRIHVAMRLEAPAVSSQVCPPRAGRRHRRVRACAPFPGTSDRPAFVMEANRELLPPEFSESRRFERRCADDGRRRG